MDLSSMLLIHKLWEKNASFASHVLSHANCIPIIWQDMGQLAMTYKNVSSLKWNERVFMCVFAPSSVPCVGIRNCSALCPEPLESPVLCARILGTLQRHDLWEAQEEWQLTSSQTRLVHQVQVVPSHWMCRCNCLQVYVASICVHVNPQQVRVCICLHVRIHHPTVHGSRFVDPSPCVLPPI